MKPTTNLLFFIVVVFEAATADYYDDRSAFLNNEALELVGSSIQLTADELKANDILMALKLEELDAAFEDPSKFLPSINFFNSKPAIEQSKVFKFIQKVPKGASLHSHSSAMVSFDFFYNLTYYDNLYGCDANGRFQLHFFFDTIDDNCEWKLLSDWRSEIDQFDNFLKSKLSLVVDNPAESYTDINQVWSKFENIFALSSPLLDYRPVLHDYLYQVLQEFYDDNVIHIEMRASLGETFDANRTYDTLETAQFYLDTLKEFKEDHFDFMGFQVIYAKSRRVSDATMEDIIREYLILQEQFPEFIAGFDLIGQEDLGRPLYDFADQLLEIANKTKFFFHAGETNWNGAPTDLNLVDAILLNTSRIGHGYAIATHPEVLRIVKDRQIAIELNPISNQVLKLVDDLRNHVGNTLIAGGYPVVISCDDPTFWGAKGLSYDWYMAFMGMTPRGGDLKVLKQFAINSIVFSSLDERDKRDAMGLFEGKWNEFINSVLPIN